MTPHTPSSSPLSSNTRKPDPRLDAVTAALDSLPLEERVPGYGHASLSGLGKAELLALLNDED